MINIFDFIFGKVEKSIEKIPGVEPEFEMDFSGMSNSIFPIDIVDGKFSEPKQLSAGRA